MKLHREVFEYVIRNARDKSNPIENVMTEINGSLPVDRIISIQEEHFVYPRNYDGFGCEYLPKGFRATVYYKA